MGKQDEAAALDGQALKFVDWFRRYRPGAKNLRDAILKAAERAKVPKRRAVEFYGQPAVQEEIDRQDEVLRVERARQEVKASDLGNELLDRELVKMILLDPEKLGSLKLEALRLGYVTTGRIQAGNTRSLAMPDVSTQGAPVTDLYHALRVTVEAQPAPIVPAPIVPPQQPPPPPLRRSGAITPEPPAAPEPQAPKPQAPAAAAPAASSSGVPPIRIG